MESQLESMSVLLRRTGRSVRKPELSPQPSMAERYAFRYRPQPYPISQEQLDKLRYIDLLIIGKYHHLEQLDQIGLISALEASQQLEKRRIWLDDSQNSSHPPSLALHLTLGVSSRRHRLNARTGRTDHCWLRWPGCTNRKSPRT